MNTTPPPPTNPAAIATNRQDRNASWPSRGHLVATGPSTWQTWTDNNAPPLPGTYAIYSHGTLMYLGSAVNLRARLLEHGIGRRWSSVLSTWTDPRGRTVKFAMARHPGDHLRREFRLIQRLAPPLNRTNRPA